MPSRVIRGEILSSASLSRVSFEAEALFWRMILAADDYGRLDGRPAVLLASLFPARPIAERKLLGWIAELEAENAVQVYSVDGRPYLALVTWEKYRSNSKRGTRSRFPEPPRNPWESAESPGIRPSVSVGDESRESSVPARKARGAPKTDPPDGLQDEEKRLLRVWAEAKYPTLATQLESMIEACLDWHRARGNRQADWVATCRTWFRNADKFGDRSRASQAALGRTNGSSQYLRRVQSEDRSETTDQDRADLARIKAEIAAEEAARRTVA